MIASPRYRGVTQRPTVTCQKTKKPPIWVRPDLMKARGTHFCGFVKGLNAYWAAEVGRGNALVYEKSEAYLKRTKPKVAVDSGRARVSVNYEVRAWFADQSAAWRVSYRES